MSADQVVRLLIIGWTLFYLMMGFYLGYVVGKERRGK